MRTVEKKKERDANREKKRERLSNRWSEKRQGVRDTERKERDTERLKQMEREGTERGCEVLFTMQALP